MKSLLPLLAAALLLASCNKSTSDARYIPKDASFVFAGDPGSLQDKLKSANLTIDSLINSFGGSDSMKHQAEMKWSDLQQAGIDMNARMYVFMTQKKSLLDGTSTAFYSMSRLKDSAAFVGFLKKQRAFKDKSVSKGSNYSYISLEKDASSSCVISWTDKMMIATWSQQTKGFSFPSDSAPKTIKVFYQGTDASAADDALKGLDRIYNLPESESLAGVKAFTDLMGEKADAYMFSSTSGTNPMAGMPLQFPKLEALLKDNYSAATLRFEDGKVVMKSKLYLNDSATALLKRYSFPDLNTSIIENYPSSNIDGALAFSFDPQIIGGVLKQADVEPMANMYMQKMGLMTSDAYSALKGNITVVVSDLALPAPVQTGFENMNANGKPTYKFLVHADINNKASFDKLMQSVVANGFVQKQGDQYSSGLLMRTIGLYLHTDNNNIDLASDSLTYVQYAAKKSSAAGSEIAARFKGKSSGFFLDVDKLTSSLAGTASSDMSKGMFSIFAATVKDMTATTDHISGSEASGEMVIRMKNEKQNSLVSFVRMLMAMGRNYRQ